MTQHPGGKQEPSARGRGGVGIVYRLLWAVCLLLLLADVWDYKEPAFSFERTLGFYGVFGFLAYAMIAGAGWLWRKVVLRDEDYYE